MCTFFLKNSFSFFSKTIIFQARQRHSYFNRFPHGWAIEEFIKSNLKNKCAYARKRRYLGDQTNRGVKKEGSDIGDDEEDNGANDGDDEVDYRDQANEEGPRDDEEINEGGDEIYGGGDEIVGGGDEIDDKGGDKFEGSAIADEDDEDDDDIEEYEEDYAGDE